MTDIDSKKLFFLKNIDETARYDAYGTLGQPWLYVECT
jgi:hypothetical protein